MIDKIFRNHGEHFFGKAAMDMITDEQVEAARVYAFTELGELTKEFGRQSDGTCEELFCNFIFGHYM